MSTRVLILAVTAALAAILGACLRPDVFRCDTGDNCRSRGQQGTCEPSGYCSYPRDDCPSGRGYDEFAGAGLANSCLELGAGTEGSGTASDGTDTETGGCPPAPRCQDADGDGFGEGEGCAGPDCDDDNPAHHDACVYVSPSGDDAAAGTRAEPWQTFDHALARLGPGQSLVLLDGTYSLATTGLPRVDCGMEGNAVAGTAEAPISIRAEQERGPLLQGDGSAALAALVGCRHWRLFGLRGRDVDARGSEGGAQGYSVDIRESEDVVVRRVLMSHSNRYFNSHLFGVLDSRRVRIEESEAYFFHREGFFITDAEEVTVRRCYARGNDYPDLPGCTSDVDPEVPYCSSIPTSGDAGFGMFRAVLRSRFENCVADGPLGRGLRISGSCHDNIIAGSIALGPASGISVNNSDDLTLERTTIADCVVVDASSNGVSMSSTTQSTVDGLSIIGAQGAGFLAQQTVDCALIPRGCSVEAQHLLSLGSGATGIAVRDQDLWQVSHANAFGGNGPDYSADEDIADQAGNVRESLAIDAGPVGVGSGQCAVFIPASSPMSGAGQLGADIGATVLYRQREGLTDEPLWDPATGAFPCGAIVPGINDDPARACIGVHERLNVATDGCALPPDYGLSDDPCG